MLGFPFKGTIRVGQHEWLSSHCACFGVIQLSCVGMIFDDEPKGRASAAAAENRGLDPTPSRVQGSIHNGTNTPVRVRTQLDALLPPALHSLVVTVADAWLPKIVQRHACAVALDTALPCKASALR
jgi:hypothetical protein